MLDSNDDFDFIVKQQKRKKQSKSTSALYEVTYTKNELDNVYDVRAKNEGEASRKVKSKFGNVSISNTVEIS